MFDQYNYISTIMSDVPEIKRIYRASGIRQMEELLQEKLRDLQYPLIVVEDDGNGYLNLDDSNFDSSLYNFFILDKPNTMNSSSRKEKLASCKKAALKLFRRMKQDSKEFKQECYGLDFSRIDYQQIGPIANGLHGYSFSYMFRDENFDIE